ncbi:hypothetical protein CBR_g3891 [Chara braunii]|uniref:Fe2OG dioxygenase domain-containing protein n=1 Tax=Chara braunii TaxID=69332 RepID=A0A388KGL7_CHABU|nr:hypothetical protein CBR_g3891 [Chara braunii]|eukprot:GBG69192.1 hypothetical protein CBR_g3891 [Chara braunii]
MVQGVVKKTKKTKSEAKVKGSKPDQPIRILNDEGNIHLQISKGCGIEYYPQRFPKALADRWMKALDAGIPWVRPEISVFGRKTLQPRETCYIADSDVRGYKYSGYQPRVHSWEEFPVAREILDKLHQALPEWMRFNSVLINRYVNGKDSVAWHSDDEPVYGDQPTIASVTLGASREFLLRRKKTAKKESVSGQNVSVSGQNVSVCGRKGEEGEECRIAKEKGVNFWEQSVKKQAPWTPSSAPDRIAVSVCGQNVSVSGQNVSVCGQNVSVSGQNVSVSGQNVSVSGQNVSVSGGKVEGEECRIAKEKGVNFWEQSVKQAPWTPSNAADRITVSVCGQNVEERGEEYRAAAKRRRNGQADDALKKNASSSPEENRADETPAAAAAASGVTERAWRSSRSTRTLLDLWGVRGKRASEGKDRGGGKVLGEEVSGSRRMKEEEEEEEEGLEAEEEGSSSPTTKYSFTLQHGSLLVMKGYTQRDWEHSVPRRAGIHTTRINLTFRLVIER